MLVVTAGTCDLKPIISAQKLRCERLGYGHVVYDLGGLEMGTPIEISEGDLKPTMPGDSLPPCLFKTDLLLREFCAGATICWLDGDCIPLKPFEPEGLWDAAVTLRPLPEIGQSGSMALDYLNAGVVWFRDELLLRFWRAEAGKWNTDQGALNQIVGGPMSKNQWIESMGRTIKTPSGHSVKVLDAVQWNCWHLPPRDDTRILHFKRGIRKLASKYCN